MYSFLHDLLADKKGGEVFTCFGIWHVCYVLFFVGLMVALFFILKDKPLDAKNKVSKIFICVAFGIYVADYFLMPIAYGEIDIETLPFHICTATCILCFLSGGLGFFKAFKWHFALLGFISNLVYLLYPAGVMWHQVHPSSYRVIETLCFHGVMSVYGFLVLAFSEQKADFKYCYRDFIVIVGITLWAMLGNFIYNGEVGEYSHFFNWFFVVRDPFYILPENIAPFIMPFFNVALFFGVEMVVYLICKALNRDFVKQI